MNVGSILNDDSPPGENEKLKDQAQAVRPDIQSIHERHSIVNLLNGPSPQIIKEDKEVHSIESDESLVKKLADAPPDLDKSPVESSKNELKNTKESEDQSSSSIVNLSGENNNESNQKTKTFKTEDGYDNSEVQDKNEDELLKIGRLKSTTKPKRYSTPPIWAHEYISQGKYSSTDNMIQVQSSLSSKPVFNPTSTVSVDLECSVTGVIPPPSVTRTIAEWIYANFNEIPDENRKYVELELKFGTIIDKRQAHRININVSTECIFTDVSSIYFDMGVHEVGWNDMCHFLDDLEKQYQEDLRKSGNTSKPKRKFNTLESDITDTFYQITNRNEQPKSIRVSKDNLLASPRYSAINKQRISDLYIHIPSSMYDLRLSLSFEHPISDSSIDSIMKKNKPNLTRIKKRNSWTHRPTITRFDMTRVLVPREFKNKAGKTSIEQDQSFEVELEIDTLELFSGFDKFKNGVDSIRFEELVEIFVNNARCLNNRVTKLANK